ncbi:hypothetical protein D3OALGA1CA_4190 [Olavius algarvensis associated proteobacterium Delta 3]|nr:hypothetical protein D3OALGB2SA_1402 [Olavius algarvensis associated proteobacterium Delta 3]CAB5146831.1 hypothetical protein D3OALGA1CA_4190 [Olavius algarvensis associated proteobacterium Delta 3]
MHKEMVRKFYSLLWDAHDKASIPSILHKDIWVLGDLKRLEAQLEHNSMLR